MYQSIYRQLFLTCDLVNRLYNAAMPVICQEVPKKFVLGKKHLSVGVK